MFGCCLNSGSRRYEMACNPNDLLKFFDARLIHCENGMTLLKLSGIVDLNVSILRILEAFRVLLVQRPLKKGSNLLLYTFSSAFQLENCL